MVEYEEIERVWPISIASPSLSKDNIILKDVVFLDQPAKNDLSQLNIHVFRFNLKILKIMSVQKYN